jgi:penicillin-binding protein 1A
MEDVVQNYNFYDNTLEAWTYKNDYGSPEEADEVIAAFKEYVSKPGDTITYEKVFYTLQPQVSFTVMDYTNGHVLALCGGRGEKTQNLTLNRAVDTTRQPGSCFKVLAAYAPALDAAGYTLGTAIDDSPFHYGGSINRDVHNWWGDAYRGLSTVREGIRDSMNVLAVKTLYDIGEDLSIQYLQNFGFTTIDPVMDAGVATALGGITNGITNKEITAAYGSIANKGVYNEPVLYTKIVSMDGTVLLDNVPESHTVLKESTASLLTSAILDVVNGGTGSAAALWTTQVAGKTGTTSDDKDLWFCGFVPNGYAASIWTGYDENVSITWGGVYHEYLWATIMSQVLAAKEREGGWFEMTGGIVQATICKKSGKIPNGSCGGDAGCVITEYFAEGTVPSAACDVHTTCRVCEASKLLPNEYCPKVVDMVCRVRPMDVTGSEPKGTTEDSKLAPPTTTCNIHNAEWESKSREEESRRKEEEESRKKEEEEQSRKDEETRDDDDG